MEKDVQIAARRFAIMNSVTGKITASRNLTMQGPIASIQKLLTALIIVERGNLDAKIEILPEDIKLFPAHIAAKAGEYYSRYDLLAGMLIGSANDAASALARDHSASAAKFSEVMNEKAAELGMSSSAFVNPSGLPAEGQFSTVEDVLKLATAVDESSQIRHIIAQRECIFFDDHQQKRKIQNRNRLLYLLPGCDGMKTGFTKASGYCLVASAFQGIDRCIAVVLNSTRQDVWQDALNLLLSRGD